MISPRYPGARRRRSRRSIFALSVVLLSASVASSACQRSPQGQEAPAGPAGGAPVGGEPPVPGGDAPSSGKGDQPGAGQPGSPDRADVPDAGRGGRGAATPGAVQAIARSARGPVGGFARTVLGGGPAGSIVFEVLAQPGAAVVDGALSRVVELLGQASGKPTTLRRVNLPDAGADSWSAEQLTRLADERSGSPQGENSQAVLHLALVHGRFEGGDSVLGVAVRGDVAAIFVDRVRDSATLLVPRGPIEEAVVVHEIGHLLGLVDLALETGREDPEHPGHSSSRDSVMYWAVESDLIADLLGAGPPTDFDDADRADLAAMRSGR